MYHCGIDLHSKVTAFHLLDGSGAPLANGTIDSTEEHFGALCRKITKATRFYVEASTGSAWFARIVEANGHQVFVVDPNRIRAIASSPKKTDAHDARTLAELGRAGLLTAVHVRTKEVDRFRRTLSARHALVRARAGLIRTSRSLLRSEGHVLPHCDGDDFSRRLQGTWGIPDGFETAVTPLVQAIDEITEQVFKAEEVILEAAAKEPEVGTYQGLAPWVISSAGKRKPGGITKRGNKATRSLLVQAAWAHVRSKADTAMKRWYYTLSGRVGKKKAITALARKIGELMWTLWSKETLYKPFPTSSRRSPAPT